MTFNSKLKFNDLVKIKLDLAERGITIQYKKIVYSEFDEWKELSFVVDCNDGYKGKAFSDIIIIPNQVQGYKQIVKYLENEKVLHDL